MVPVNAGFTASADYLVVQFTDSSAPTTDETLTDWYWNFGDGNESSSQNPSHTYSNSGTYNVSLTVTDSGGNSDTYASSISVSAKSSCGVDPGNEQHTSMASAYKFFFPLLIALLALAVFRLTRKRQRFPNQ